MATARETPQNIVTIRELALKPKTLLRVLGNVGMLAVLKKEM
jgi:hypothetical protein